SFAQDVMCPVRSCLFMFGTPLESPLFPYTTLFRSHGRPSGGRRAQHPATRGAAAGGRTGQGGAAFPAGAPGVQPLAAGDRGELRSEEHTSELQSRENLVCRLLLEKKKL